MSDFQMIEDAKKTEFQYVFYLCQSSTPFNIVGDLTNCTSNRAIKWQLRGVDELSMTIYDKHEDGSDNELYQSIETTNVIRMERWLDSSLDKTYLFHISEVNISSSTTNTKEIKAYSLEIRMNKQSVRDFKFDEIEIQIYTGLWDDTDLPNSGVVDYILTLLKNTWTVNYISPSLLNSGRLYNISSSKILEVVKTIEDNYNCTFIFNTHNQSIDIVHFEDTDYPNFLSNTGIILDRENYIEQYTSQVNVDEIVTRLNISGANNTDVTSINILGDTYIDDFSFFMNTKYMTQGLITALTNLNNLRASKASEYSGLLTTLGTRRSESIVLVGELSVLETQLMTLEDNEDMAIKVGTHGGKTYAQWKADSNAKLIEVNNKKSAITAKQGEIDGVLSQLQTLRNLVSYETNLTLAQQKELVNFIQEEDQSFDTEDIEVLLELGQAYLNIKSKSQYDISVNMVDIFGIQEFSYDWDKIRLGSKVNLILDDNTTLEPIITSIDHNYDDNGLSITVSNKTYLNDDLNYLTAIWAKFNSTSTIFDKERNGYNEYIEDKEDIQEFINSPINVNSNVIDIGDEAKLIQQAQINRRGIYGRDSEITNGQMRIFGDRILFTRTNWQPDGDYPGYSVSIDSTGIKTTESFKLISDNEFGGKNLVEINGNGIDIHGSDVAGRGIRMFNKFGTQTFGLDANGNISMTGTLSIIGGSGISNLTDAGVLATANNLDGVPNGSTYYRTTANQVTGAGRAFSALDSSNDVVSRVKPSVSMGNPSTAGLYMGSDYIGFHNGNSSSTGWTAYIKNNGQFKFQGNSTNFVEWDGFNLNVRGTLNASDIKSGTITATYINTSGLSAEKIYQVGSPNNYAVMGGTYGDVELYRNNNRFFRIFNAFDSVSLQYVTQVGGNNVHTTFLNSDGLVTFAQGTWNFSGATIQNFNVKFA